MAGRTYRHRFEDGPGGWVGWSGNDGGARALEIGNGAAISRSPWWIDYNHAPPGGGYLHLLYALHTRHPPGFPAEVLERGGRNTFVEGRYPLDFRNARAAFDVWANVEWHGARLALLAQARVGERYVNHVLAAQPLEARPEWSRQTVVLVNDPRQWKCLGPRHDRTDRYGEGDIGHVLRDLNADIILTLYPLDVRPLRPLEGHPHRLRAGEDYPVDPDYLPHGCVRLREVTIEFAA